MLLKPDACKGCPLYGDGKGFVPDVVHERSPIEVWGQNPGAQEEAEGVPFVGRTGLEMDKVYFRRAGITRDQCTIRNVIRCRMNHTNELPKVTETIVADALAHCQRAHYKPTSAPLIITQGDYAALAATGDHSSTDWRGWLVPLVGTEAHGRHLREPWVPVRGDRAVLVTVHLARLFRDATLKLATGIDWTKVSRIMRGNWPRKPPEFLWGPPQQWFEVQAFDTEFARSEDFSGRLTRYSLSHGVNDRETYVCEADEHITPDWPDYRPRVVTQYAPADIRHLACLSRMSVREVWTRFLIDDTVQKHSALYSDSQHDLDFLGSLFASINRWKHLGEASPQVYAGCDSLGTLEVDICLERELDRDPATRKVYEEIDRPVIQDFTEAQYAGLRIDQPRRSAVERALNDDIADAQARATATAGWPINLASNPQVGHRLFVLEGLPRPKGLRSKR
jgi:uracil-DNA glycosylase family 4